MKRFFKNKDDVPLFGNKGEKLTNEIEMHPALKSFAKHHFGNEKGFLYHLEKQCLKLINHTTLVFGINKGFVLLLSLAHFVY